MIELVGTLVEIRATAEPSWAAGNLQVDGEDAPQHLRGAILNVSGPRLGQAQLGEALRLSGELEQHPKYGAQFKVREQERLGVRTQDSAHLWLEELAGVGPMRARRIAQALGDRLLAVLENPPAWNERDPLLDVESVAQKTVGSIRASWAKLCERVDPATLQYLASLQLTRREQDVVLAQAKFRKQTAKEFLESDPYSIIEVYGFGFMRADAIAISAGIAKEAPARIEAAVRHYLGELVRSHGHTVVTQRSLIAKCCEAMNVEAALVGQAIDRMSAGGGIKFTKQEDGALVHLPNLLQAEQKVWAFIQHSEEIPF